MTTLTEVTALDVPVWTGDPLSLHARTWLAQVTAAAIHPASNRFLLHRP